MSHVDEGLLHAYIDGALEAGSPERADIDTHLAACADCRVRLEDALRTKNAAAQALQSVAPGPVDMPSWDTILAEHARRSGAAGAVPAKRARRPFVPLAWAASLFVALGAGWMARVMLAEREMTVGFEEHEALMMPVSELDEARRSGFDSAAPERLQRANEQEAIPSAPPPQTALPAPTAAAPTTAGARQRRDAPLEKAGAGITLSGEVRDGMTGRPLAGAAISLPGTPLGDVTDSAGRFRILNVPAGNVAVEAKVLGYADERRTLDLRGDTTPPLTFRLEQQSVALEEVVVTGAERASFGAAVVVTAWRPVTMEEARDSLGTAPVVVADATPDSVLLGNAAARSIVRMVYTVEGETLELQQSRSTGEADAARREVLVDSVSTSSIRGLTITLKGPPALVESIRRRLR